MSSKHLGADYVLAWPSAEIAVMGPREAIEIIYKRELEKAPNPEEVAKEFVEKYRREITTPFFAASRGYVDDVILPRETRAYMYKALLFLRDKREKHQRPPRKYGVPPV
jgi:acetyl-CoA/propionyl-CoA carboxylase